jgi:guanylate kinase
MSGAPVIAGTPFVVAAPSGTGKTTVCRKMVERDGQISFSVSHTTRKQRQGEVEGRDYFFVDQDEFRQLVADETFLEWAQYGANCYGTSWKAIEGPLASGHDMLLEIEVQGAQQVRARRDDARMIFLLPPNKEALMQRLQGRGTDDLEEIQRRLKEAERELGAVCDFDYAVLNDDLEVCVANLLEIIQGERSRSIGDLRERFSPALAEEKFRGARSPEV